MTRYGPMELIVVGFPGKEFHGDIVPAIQRVVDQGVIRVADLLFVTMDDDGEVWGMEVGDLSDQLQEAYGSLGLGDDSLLSEEDVEDLGVALSPGSSVAVVLFEHLWARDLAGALASAEAEVLSVQRIPSEAVAGVLADRAAS